MDSLLPSFQHVTGIHPGAILRYALQQKKWSGKGLAALINEHPQTISAILNERRGINPALSIKLAGEFGVENDYFMLLQAAWEVKQASKQATPLRPAPELPKALFWDTNFDQIHWQQQSRAVIQRVLERGSERDLQVLLAYYGPTTLHDVASQLGQNALPGWQANYKKLQQWLQA